MCKQPLVLRTLGPAALLIAASCASSPTQPRDVSWSVGASALPNLGLTTGMDQVFHRSGETSYALEALFTFQPWDDEDVISDGHPHAGDFAQFQLGVKRARPSQEDRWWTSRAGAVWFRAKGEPNIVQLPGDYLGLYAGAGFELQVNEHLTMGPDLSLLVVSLERSGDVDVVPQLAWRVTFGF